MKKRFELFATVSEWTDPATGRKCKRTAQIGTVFESPSGRLSMKLELLPLIPGWSGFVAFRDVTQPDLDPTDQEPAHADERPATGSTTAPATRCDMSHRDEAGPPAMAPQSTSAADPAPGWNTTADERPGQRGGHPRKKSADQDPPDQDEAGPF